MRVRTLLVVLLLVLIAAFAAANWSAFMAPTSLSLLVTSFEAPLGLMMLGLLGVVVLAFAVYMAVWQGTLLMESRRNAAELQKQRTLADQAEASRFTELRGALHDEMVALGERMTQNADALRAEIRDNGNSLAASVAEMDDRLQRSAGTR
ncbi:MAG: LapA family protein [Caldimonas sp.]